MRSEDGPQTPECPACGGDFVVGDELDGLYGERVVDECPRCGMTAADCEREAADARETEAALHAFANRNIARELARLGRGRP